MQTSLPALSAYHLSGSICFQELKDILFFPHKIIVERKKKSEIDSILVHLLKLNQITDFLDCAQIKQEWSTRVQWPTEGKQLKEYNTRR